MKSLSSIERIVLDVIGKGKLDYFEIQSQTGLHENVCFNVLQALIIRGILVSEGAYYRMSEKISPLVMEEINSLEAKQAESLEMIEAVIEQKAERIFRYQKIALDTRDEKIFYAMLSNLESFLIDAHKKSHQNVPLKERKVVFWGVGEVKNLMTQIVQGH